MSTAWYDYSLYSDYPTTSYHNTDVGTPADTPLTAPLSGTITADTYQAWGGQLTVQADDPSQIGGIPYYFLIHLDAINPALQVGSHVNQGDFLGYSGGQLDNSGLPALPAGYSHHVTDPSHSTGPHLDIGVTDSPQGSLDTNKTWSDRLVTFARQLGIPYGTGQGQNTATADTKGQWAVDLLAALGNTNPDQAQVEFVSGWEHAESGSSGGAQNNPLNTEEVNTPGVVSDFNPAGVKNYDTYQHGIQAEAKVLNNGLYAPLLQALQTPGPQSDAALGVPGGNPSQGVIDSLNEWGTHDWSAIYSNLGAGGETINVTGATFQPQGSTGLCAYCSALPASSRPLVCILCAATGNNGKPVAGSDPIAQILNYAMRAAFMALGGGLILVGSFIAIKSLGEETGITEKVQGTVKRVGEGIATGGESEVARAASKVGVKPSQLKSKKAAPAAKAA